MFGYISTLPKGTFTNDQLQSFINVGWLTQDEYNQLAVNENAGQPAQ